MKYTVLAPQKVKLCGPIGKTLDKIIQNRFLKMDWDHLVAPFRLRNETDDRWRCEFWGKIIRSAILAWRTTGNPDLREIIDRSVSDILNTQSADGCISSYPVEKQLQGWDIWGRKYVLLGLLRYYRDAGERAEVLRACCRLADHFIAQIGDRPLNSFGWHGGLAACSSLGAFVQLYQYSGNLKYLDFARKIIECGCSLRHNIFEQAEEFIPPAEIGNGKAYEMMSCFQGLAAYNAIAETQLYPEAPRNFFYLMRNHEIFITGTGGLKDSCGEYDYDGRFKQSRTDSGSLGETCITATWLHYCEHMLLLNGNIAAAEAMEMAFINAAIGSVKDDGSWFCHVNPTPLCDFAPKIPAHDQLPGFGEDCCVAQGPEAVALAAYLAVVQSPEGYLVNLYENMRVAGLFNISGNYPYDEDVKIEMVLAEPREFSLGLRIPEWWNAKCTLQVNGKTVVAKPRKVAQINRKWQKGDNVTMHFDLAVRRIEAPGDPSHEAFMSGPLVLVESSRLPKSNFPLPEDTVFTALPAQDGFACLKQVTNGGVLCDYASAGNTFKEEDLLRVFFARKLPKMTPYTRNKLPS